MDASRRSEDSLVSVVSPVVSTRAIGNFVNPIFLTDDPQPPSYSSIFPVTSTDVETEAAKPAEQQYDPIRYEDYMCFASVVDGRAVSNELSLSPSCRFLFQNAPDQAMPGGRQHDESTTRDAMSSFDYLSSSQQFNLIREMRLKKYLADMYPREYLLRHCVFVTVGSVALIAFQILLMGYASILSHLASGIWCGVINLLTLSFTLITLKFGKLYLLTALIVNHFLCIMINLGALVIVNCVAATRYNTCSYYSSGFNPPDTLQFTDRTYCQHYTNNVKYINIAIIVLGATCMFLFVNFFFKLIAIFNNVHSNRD